MRRTRLITLLLSMLFFSISSNAKIIASGTCGKNVAKSVKWELDDNGVLTISGEGPMKDFDKSKAPWLKHHSLIEEVVIEDGVTSIGSYAFAEVNKVTMSRIDIIDNTSLYCDELESVVIGKSVVSIGDRAFYDCDFLDRVIIKGESLLSIGIEAFSGCLELTNINLPNSVQTIGERAFFACSSLSNIVIPNSVQTIEKHTFSSCDELESITIPNSVKVIKDRAFAFCDELTSIHIPASVISIGEEAIPRIHITVSEDNPCYCAIDDILYTKAMDTLLFCLEDKIGEVRIPDGVKHIKDEAFENCSDVTNIILPNSLLTIGEDVFAWCDNLHDLKLPNSLTCIGDGAFTACYKLTNLYIPSSVVSIGDDVFDATPVHITVSEENPRYSSNDDLLMNKAADTVFFCSLEKQGTVEIPNTVKHINQKAFELCNKITNVIIPNSVESIGWAAFADCKGLHEITLPNSVTAIETSAFSYCDSLKTFRIGSSLSSFASNDGMTLYGCPKLTQISVSEDNPYFAVKDGILYSKAIDTLIVCPKHLESITIPSTVKEMRHDAFDKCEKLTSVYMQSVMLYNSSFFNGINRKQLTIYVPKGTKKRFEKNGWTAFDKIVEYDFK